MIHDPHRQTLTAVVSLSHPAFVLLDDPDRSLRVSRWGRVIAQLAQSGTCAALQVLEATIPDPGRSQSDWWEAHGSHDGGWAPAQYETLLQQVRLDSSVHRTTISLSLDLRGSARAVKAAGRGIRGAADVLRGDMACLTDSLRQAGLRPLGWLNEAALAGIVRQAFDPTVLIDDPSDTAAKLARGGPVAVSESWHRLRHDSGWSAVLWVSEWPRITVPPDFLHPLVFAPEVLRTLSITSRPLPTDAALRQIPPGEDGGRGRLGAKVTPRAAGRLVGRPGIRRRPGKGALGDRRPHRCRVHGPCHGDGFHRGCPREGRSPPITRPLPR